MANVTLIHHPADREDAAQIAAGLAQWGLAAEPTIKTVAGQTAGGAILVLWTATSCVDAPFLTAVMALADPRRVDIALGEVAAPAVDPVRLAGWPASGTADAGWAKLVDRLTTAVYGDPSRGREAAPELQAPTLAVTNPVVAVAGVPASVETFAPRQPIAPKLDVPATIEEMPEPRVASRTELIWRSAPLIVWGALLYTVAIFLLSPLLGAKPVGTDFPDRAPGSIEVDTYTLSTLWTPLFLLPLFLPLWRAEKIGWKALIVIVAAISGVHFLATFGGFFFAMMMATKDGKPPLGEALASGSLIGSLLAFVLLLIYRPLRRWEVMQAGALFIPILLAAAMVPLLMQSDARIFTIILYPLWQILFGVAVLWMFLTPPVADAAD